MSRYRRVIDTLRADRQFLDPEVPLSNVSAHEAMMSTFNQPGMRILELGSREVTGASDARQRFAKAEYVGFDYYAGPNVDVVGDAHRLLSYFPNQQFDLIFSTAVFEHLAMPWLVAPQIARLLKVGGCVRIATHFSYSSHERPWHFFQFSDMALRVLFSPAMGIECVDAGASNPMVGYFSSMAEARLQGMRVRGLYCGSEFLGRKVRDVELFDWSNVDVAEVVSETHYPQPHGALHDSSTSPVGQKESGS
jgi:SAM-dependent methyltransferase